MSGRVQKVMIPPINFIFKLLQQHTPVSIWLFEQTDIRLQGQIRVRNLLYGKSLHSRWPRILKYLHFPYDKLMNC